MVYQKEEESIVYFSIKVILTTLIGIILLGLYFNILFNGENSLSVLKKLKREKVTLEKRKEELKKENQKLQKEYFELKQLEIKD